MGRRLLYGLRFVLAINYECPTPGIKASNSTELPHVLPGRSLVLDADRDSQRSIKSSLHVLPVAGLQFEPQRSAVVGCDQVTVEHAPMFGQLVDTLPGKNYV